MSQVTVPAVGDQITATWGDTVANQLNQMTTSLGFVPTGTLSTPTSGAAVWLALGNVTVPSWAVSAIVTVSINIFGMPVAAVNHTVVQAKIGTQVGARAPFLPGSNSVLSQLMTFTDKVTGLSPGTQAVAIVATFQSGSGQFQATTSSDVSIDITFLGA